MEGYASHMYLIVHATLCDSIIVINEVVWSTGSISIKSIATRVSSAALL